MKAAWDEELASHRADFEEGLARAGFKIKESLWHGTINRAAGTVGVTIVLPDEFPLRTPKVYPSDDGSVPWSWHREKDGALCLIAEEDYSDLWWTNVSAFLAHIARWFEEADKGWPNDRPELDLDRYFESSIDTTLILYPALEEYRNSYVRFAGDINNTLALKGFGRVGGKPSRKTANGYVGDLGELISPPRSWTDIVPLLADGARVESGIHDGGIRLLLLTYTRGDRQGVLALDAKPDTAGGVRVRSRASASTVMDARTLRGGPDREVLSRMSVAIVGVGAIGSHVANLMLRAGIAELTLVDSDVLKPGNVIRHFAGPNHVGLAKVEAVARTLKTIDGVRTAQVRTRCMGIFQGQDALALVKQHDLVIDATANFSCTALLRAAAQATGKQIVSGCIQNGGQTARVDILPPHPNQQAVSDSRLPVRIDQTAPNLFEPGCSSPVSPATPQIVNLAAAMTSHYAVEVLAGKSMATAGQVIQFIPRSAQ